MKKIIQTLQQALDLIDTRDRKKMQQIKLIKYID